MKIILSLSALILALGCSSPKTNKKPSNQISQTKEHTTSKKNDPENEKRKKDQVNPQSFQISTYDDPEFADQVSEHQVSLKGLAEKGVFSMIHAKLIQKLGPKQQAYLTSKPDYELLALAKGNLFRENKTDLGFIVYDKKSARISILIYREKTNRYLELFRDLKVENGLENADCNYGMLGTLDYILAEELIYQEEYLMKNPLNYLESSPIQITDIAKNEDFFLKDGCFSKKASKKETSNSLAIATSSVYNNWEALHYNETNNSFVIYYGQAFAD